LCQKGTRFTDHQPRHILDYEVTGVQFYDHPREFKEQLIPRIIRLTFADEGETLAGRATEHHVYFVAITQASLTSDLGARKP